jgi:DhnA family fructose-bisphosphate aldolase class Ia
MKTARLNRLFNPRTGRCFDVALDHGFFIEGAFLAGIENLPKAIETVVAAGIVYGRNIIQHASPAKITRALMAVVHDGVTPADALAFLR